MKRLCRPAECECSAGDEADELLAVPAPPPSLRQLPGPEDEEEEATIVTEALEELAGACRDDEDETLEPVVVEGPAALEDATCCGGCETMYLSRER